MKEIRPKDLSDPVVVHELINRAIEKTKELLAQINERKVQKRKWKR